VDPSESSIQPLRSVIRDDRSGLSWNSRRQKHMPDKRYGHWFPQAHFATDLSVGPMGFLPGGLDDRLTT